MNNPIFQRELYDLFGTPNNGQFANDYLTTVDLTEFASDFAHVLDYEGNHWKHKIYCNYIMEDQLRASLNNIVNRGLAQELQTYDGCFNIRKMKASGSLSVHSWGLAVDFNAAQNPFGGIVTFSDGFIKCFADAGFEAGALWHTPDGMHFQLPWTQDWRQSDNSLAPVVWNV
jgi:hypothetical protein